MPELNVPLLREIQRIIRLEPKKVNMNNWKLRGHSLKGTSLQVPPCGTVCCIAGWVVELTPRVIEGFFEGVIETQALEILGIANPAWKECELFYPAAWPDNLYERLYRTQLQTPAYVEVVCEAIDRFIEGGGKFIESNS